PGLHVFAAVDDDRTDAMARELVRAEEPGRAVPDDDDAVLARDGSRVGSSERCRLPVGKAHEEMKPNRAAPRVERAPPEHDLGQLRRRAAQAPRHELAERRGIVGVVEPELELELTGETGACRSGHRGESIARSLERARAQRLATPNTMYTRPAPRLA